MENLLVVILLLSILGIFIFAILGIISFIKKTNKKGSKMLLGSIVSLIICVISIIGLGKTSDSNTDGYDPDAMAARLEATESVNAEVSKNENKLDEKKKEEPEEELSEAEIEEQEFNEHVDMVESSIQEIIDQDFSFDTSIINFELNENLGTDEPDDYIALVYLSYDQLHTAKTTKKWIDTYTSHLAATLAEEDNGISSLNIFWETPEFKDNWNTAKFTLKKQGKKFVYDTQYYDGTVFN